MVYYVWCVGVEIGSGTDVSIWVGYSKLSTWIIALRPGADNGNLKIWHQYYEVSFSKSFKALLALLVVRHNASWLVRREFNSIFSAHIYGLPLITALCTSIILSVSESSSYQTWNVLYWHCQNCCQTPHRIEFLRTKRKSAGSTYPVNASCDNTEINAPGPALADRVTISHERSRTRDALVTSTWFNCIDASTPRLTRKS